MARHRRDVERLSRPVFRVLLLALAWLLRADTVDYGRFLMLALLLGLVRDWLRHGRLQGSPLADRASWATLLLSRVGYLVAIVLMPGSAGSLWLGLGLVAILLVWAARPRAGAGRARELARRHTTAGVCRPRRRGAGRRLVERERGRRLGCDAALRR